MNLSFRQKETLDAFRQFAEDNGFTYSGDGTSQNIILDAENKTLTEATSSMTPEERIDGDWKTYELHPELYQELTNLITGETL